MSIPKHINNEQGCPLVMSNGRREISPRRMMSVVAEDDEELTEQPVPRTRSPRMAKACLQEGADGPTVKTSLLSKSPNLEHSSRPSKHAGWKTSKFFSRSMASGELLRGFKKLSFSSSGEELESRYQTEPKQYKGRLGSLRKRPTSDDIAMGSDLTSSSPGNLGEVKKEKGIVCKKDDIFSIIASVSQSPTASPATRRTPLRYTKSASFDPTPTDPSYFCEPSVPLMAKVEPEIPEAKPKDSKDSEEEEKDDVVSEDVFECTEEESVPEEESKVQWDDSNVVDAMLLGGAIEAFLKGSMGVGGVEKRVSFKKP